MKKTFFDFTNTVPDPNDKTHVYLEKKTGATNT